MAGKKHHEAQPEFEGIVQEKTENERHLILHNDEVHTFEYVIETLIKICELEAVQAEQCTYLVHYKGKCDVKKGTYTFLKPYKQGLVDKGLEATID